MFNLNSTFIDAVAKASSACGYTDYSATYATYPPNGTLPLPKEALINGDIKSECQFWRPIVNAALSTNPAFNMYKVTDIWPMLWVRKQSVVFGFSKLSHFVAECGR